MADIDTAAQLGRGSGPLRRLPTRLHHHAYVSSDLEPTRQFYEDVLGLPLIATWAEADERSEPRREYCHAFFGLGDGGALAFFQFAHPEEGEAFRPPKRVSPYVHIALAVDAGTQQDLHERLEEAGVGSHIIDHGYCRSLYVSDPDGLLLEFTVDPPEVDQINALRRQDARGELARWLGGDHRTNNDWRAAGH